MKETDRQTGAVERTGPTQEQINEAYADYVATRPLPPDHELDDAECHNCGEPWGDEWDERYIPARGGAIGETWLYECPGCEHETFEVGT